jgi:hypothetical protein
MNTPDLDRFIDLFRRPNKSDSSHHSSYINIPPPTSIIRSPHAIEDDGAVPTLRRCTGYSLQAFTTPPPITVSFASAPAPTGGTGIQPLPLTFIFTARLEITRTEQAFHLRWRNVFGERQREKWHPTYWPHRVSMHGRLGTWRASLAQSIGSTLGNIICNYLYNIIYHYSYNIIY